MTGQRSFGPGELGGGDSADLRDALEAARWLQASIEDAPMRTNGAFADRVMAAIAHEPVPATTGFLAPVRQRGFLAGFGASVRDAWGSIGAGRPTLMRAAALAYVLVVAIAGASLTGIATIGAAGALRLLGESPTQSPPVLPSPTTALPPTVAPLPTPTVPPSVPPSIAPTPSPSESPDESEGPDDHGGNSGPGGGDDDDDHDSLDSESGSDDADATPDPTRTPMPSETPG